MLLHGALRNRNGCLVLVVSAWFVDQRPVAGYLIAGGVSYVVGAAIVTIVFNVPRNERLAAVNPGSAEAARLWTECVRSWTAWNHLRAVAALIAAALLTIALSQH